jgi:aspartyl-tRNA(Asn)/glutamyl-tRNA(Gln) amidotransferase subunit A
VVAGHDPRDPSSAALTPPDFAAELEGGVAGLRIGYAREFFALDTVSPETVAALDAAAATLQQLGADVEEVALPSFALFNACGRVILAAEAYAIHERDLASRPRDYGRYTYQRMIVGATLSAADLTQAMRLRRELAVAVNAGPLSRHDVLLTATVHNTAPRFDEFPVDWPPRRAPARRTRSRSMSLGTRRSRSPRAWPRTACR